MKEVTLTKIALSRDMVAKMLKNRKVMIAKRNDFDDFCITLGYWYLKTNSPVAFPQT